MHAKSEDPKDLGGLVEKISEGDLNEITVAVEKECSCGSL